MTTTAWAAIGAAVVAPLLTYLGVVRRLSGKVRTSDAAQLWEESRSLREMLQERNEFLWGVIDRHNERIETLEQRVSQLSKRNQELTEEKQVLEKLVRAHEETIRHLKAENELLKRRVAELEATSDG